MAEPYGIIHHNLNLRIVSLMSNPKRLPLYLLGIAALCAALPGCRLFHRHTTVVAPIVKPVHAPLAPLVLDLTKVQPNEAGEVPILEYHNLTVANKVTGYSYPIASFRKDVQWLYTHNYRPINLSDYVQGKIDVPAGMSPVIFTFDDALVGQFIYDADGKVDPNSGVGVLEDFHAKHPDWALKGTFFVLTDQDPKLPPPFCVPATSGISNQYSYAQAKMQHLVQDGFEIGNHTVHHLAGIRHWPDARVMAEFAGAVTGIHKYLPDYHVQTLALPYGVYPKNQKLVISGESGGVQYHNICALLAGAAPAPSPMSPRFKPYRLPRIIPGEENFALQYWL